LNPANHHAVPSVAKTNSNITIALLRGINVGGKAIVPMKQLVKCLQLLGYEDVRTYIQSGNVAFRSPTKLSVRAAEQISAAVAEVCGVKPGVQLLSAAELNDIIERNPYPEAVDDPSKLHVFFLSAVPASPNVEAMSRLKSPAERYELAPRALYLHAPEGIGRSKLAAAVERLVGVSVTARNWRTIQKLREMASE